MDPGHRAGLWWCQDLNPSAAWLNYFLCCLEPGTPALPCGLCTVARALAEWDIHARQAPYTPAECPVFTLELPFPNLLSSETP